MSYQNKIKTIFIGTPDFGIPALRALINDEQFAVIGVITQPDKKTGRKQEITPPPVKTEAQKYKIPLWQPDKISEFYPQISGLNPDLIVLAAYAQILPKNIIDMPKYGCINIHASLLPKHRGASCIQTAILNGDKETGISIMKMDEGLDTGPILWQEKIEIKDDDTTGSLFGKLSKLGGQILIPSLRKHINGEIKLQPQDNSRASYAGIIKKEDGRINWLKSAEEIERLVRAMSPWPGTFTLFEQKILKVLAVKQEPLKINKYKTGEVFLHNNKPAVQCGQDALIIEKIQLAGKKETIAQEFLRGHQDFVGSILK